MDYADVDLKTGALLIRSGKGRKSRVTFLGAISRREVLRYLRFRTGPEPSEPLFATKTGTRLSYSALRDIIRLRARDAGIGAPTLHAFRRGFALACLRNDVDLISLQRMMGHSDLSVLRRYLAQTQEDLRRAHEKGGPVDRLLRRGG